MKPETNKTERPGDGPADPPPHRTAVDDFAASIGVRNLMIIIVTMPLVFIVVVMAIIAVFGGDDEEPALAEAPAPVERGGAVRSSPADNLVEPAPGVPAVKPLRASVPSGVALPAGAEAGAIALDGDRLAIRIDGPDGVTVVIYDVTTGERVQTISVSAGDGN